jgi:hypothetical protein
VTEVSLDRTTTGVVREETRARASIVSIAALHENTTRQPIKPIDCRSGARRELNPTAGIPTIEGRDIEPRSTPTESRLYEIVLQSCTDQRTDSLLLPVKLDISERVTDVHRKMPCATRLQSANTKSHGRCERIQ